MISDGWSIDPLPVIEIEAENEKEAKHLLLLISSRYGHITDDGLYEFIMTSELNFDELKEEIDLPEIDFKQFEQNYFTNEPKDAEVQIDKAEELNKKWQVKMGDLWQIGEHRLLCGDSTKREDVERVMGGEKAKMMVTDPPYGTEYDPNWREEYGLNQVHRGKVLNDDISDWKKAWHLFTGDIAYVWSSDRFAFETVSSLISEEFEVRNQIIWAKTRIIISRGHYHPQHEVCWYLVRKGKTANWIGSHKESTLWTIEHAKSETGHSAEKPLECILKPIRNHEGDVYDPFLGSGTTMVACQNLNRKCRGIEISPAYCAVILDRMATAFPGIEIKRI
jgi:DNA modification methylase